LHKNTGGWGILLPRSPRPPSSANGGSGEEPLPSLSLPPYFLTSLLPYLSPVQSLRFQLRYK
jgi:hypothetical protein